MNTLPAAVFSDLIQKIEEARMAADKKGKPFIIAIDGRCASGKTTLGNRLAEFYRENARLFHMDNYYLRPEQRTEKRYQTPGENVDHERFLDQVLLPASQGKKVISQDLICPDLILSEPETVSCPPIMIVEGSYSLHPSLYPYYDFKIFMDCPQKTQLERIIRRNGPYKAEEFRTRWIPLEEHYIESLHPENQADLMIGYKDETSEEQMNR